MRLFEGTQFDRPPKCDRCEKLEAECTCEPEPLALPDPSTQTAKLAVEKRRKGKTVTVIRGLAAEDNNLQDLLTTLKNKCGAGGTIQDDCLEIQGMHLERITEVLKSMEYKVKR